MSLNGINTFSDNLNKLMNSEVYKKSSEIQKWKMGYSLFNSKYGIGGEEMPDKTRPIIKPEYRPEH